MYARNLPDLPVELINDIVRRIDPTSFFSLRLVCRELTAKSFDTFSERYFRTREHFISDYSLDALVDISRHGLLGPAVETLIIDTDPFQECLHLPAPLPASPGDFVSEHEEALLQFVEDQDFRRATGKDAILLALALGNLRNCKNIEIGDYKSFWISKHRKTWGVMKTSRQLGLCGVFEIGSNRSTHDALSYVFLAILSAAEASHAIIHRLSMHLSAANWMRFETLLFPVRVLDRLRSVTSNLKVLDVSVALPQDGILLEEYEGWASLFSAASNLEELHIRTADAKIEHFENTFGRYFLQEYWNRLKIFQLRGCMLSGSVLLAFLLKHRRTLEHLQLAFIDFLQGSCVSFLRQAIECLSLHKITFRALAEDTQHRNQSTILGGPAEGLSLNNGLAQDSSNSDQTLGELSPFVEISRTKKLRILTYDRDRTRLSEHVPWSLLVERHHLETVINLK
ncbi:uncharacterized protein K452DRAFT_282837 [Aplosporella prunicola CBS 121167]|uniref:F-box domain-containing protein n=1 Tax=Aplosporella prunicola CBS 121167 TaxID=1176127 RepID=A0A6A6BRD1_9PEZI|nr:uncharacterized protein K452DRAFT_282837 [Aplosporella prunicola CBS 121167]KAF2146662.1 hypothetical protein K452DRAFT_282837 [Aplosporella prunicola CBS 121167]